MWQDKITDKKQINIHNLRMFLDILELRAKKLKLEFRQN